MTNNIEDDMQDDMQDNIDIPNDIWYNLIECCSGIMEQYLDDNMVDYYKSSFEETMIKYTKELLLIQILPILNNLSHNMNEQHVTEQHVTDQHVTTNSINNTVDDLIKETQDIIYNHIIPHRVFVDRYDKTTISSTKVRNIKQKINRIRQKPQPEQRTDEWYNFRHGIITASNAFKVVGTQSKINEIICEKCKPLEIPTDVNKTENETENKSEGENTKKVNQVVSTTTPFHWGIKYEPISVAYYEYVNKTKIEDFGCIKHDTILHLGASPDGICVDRSSPLYGRMLEIKNPFTRIITGIPKDEYWIQMQLQMEVCDLDYCDFLETKFIEYDSYNDYIADVDKDNDKDTDNDTDIKYKGVIIHFIKDGKPYYKYPPFNCTKEEFDNWEEEAMNDAEKEELNWVQNIYWKLEQVSTVLIKRNHRWFSSFVPELGKVWNIIKEERKTGEWSKRIAKSKPRTTNKTNNITKLKSGSFDITDDYIKQVTNNKCVIEIDI